MEILYCKPTHIACIFKEFMIQDDINELFEKYFTRKLIIQQISWHAQLSDLILKDSDVQKKFIEYH